MLPFLEIVHQTTECFSACLYFFVNAELILIRRLGDPQRRQRQPRPTRAWTPGIPRPSRAPRSCSTRSSGWRRGTPTRHLTDEARSARPRGAKLGGDRLGESASGRARGHRSGGLSGGADIRSASARARPRRRGSGSKVARRHRWARVHGARSALSRPEAPLTSASARSGRPQSRPARRGRPR